MWYDSILSILKAPIILSISSRSKTWEAAKCLQLMQNGQTRNWWKPNIIFRLKIRFCDCKLGKKRKGYLLAYFFVLYTIINRTSFCVHIVWIGQTILRTNDPQHCLPLKKVLLVKYSIVYQLSTSKGHPPLYWLHNCISYYWTCIFSRWLSTSRSHFKLIQSRNLRILIWHVRKLIKHEHFSICTSFKSHSPKN